MIASFELDTPPGATIASSFGVLLLLYVGYKKLFGKS
jgi:hypothetical protein